MSNFTRRDFLRTTGAAITWAGVACALPGRSAAGNNAKSGKKRPNIILLVTDDQAREQFNFLPEGKNENGITKNLTPNIDSLYSEGIHFANAYCASPLCTPSRYNCLTGRYAGTCQWQPFCDYTEKNSGQTCVQWNSYIAYSTVNVARALSTAGYFTGIVGKDHCFVKPDPERERLHQLVPRDADPSDPEIDRLLKNYQSQQVENLKKHGFDYAAAIYNNIVSGGSCRALEYTNLDWIIKGAFDFMDEASRRNKPFFLHIATNLTHGPRYGGESYKKNPLATPAGLLEKPLDVLPPRHTIGERVKEAGKAPSTADVTWLDDGIGALLNKLRDLDIDDNTIIIYFNDHGKEPGGKGSLYQSGVHSICLAWGKSTIKGSREVNAMIQNTDFVPTILDLCGTPKTNWPKMDGKSFRPLLNGSNKKIHESLYFEMGNTRAVIKDGFKYLAFRPSDRLKNMTYQKRKELLDLTIRIHQLRTKDNVNTWPVTDPNKPFGHLGLYPGGTACDRKSEKAYPNYNARDQLYDLKNDPMEQNNLAGKPAYKQRLNALKKELAGYLKNQPGSFGEFNK